jgi:hypothetical protein
MSCPVAVRVLVPSGPAVVRVVTPGPPGTSTGDGAGLSDAAPLPLAAVADPGESEEASRADHEHALPSAQQVGADPTGTASTAIASHLAAADPHSQYTTPQEAAAAAPVQSVALSLPSGWSTQATSTGGNVTLSLGLPTGQTLLAAADKAAWDAAATRVAQLGEDDSPTFSGLTVSGTATLSHIHGNLAGQVYEHLRNTSGGPLPALTPYRVTGSQGDTDRVTIVAARADDPALMPASGILAEALANNADGHGVVGGVITGVNTAGFTSGASLWVAPTGGLTATRPSERIQPIATVGRVHASTGTIVVLPGPALALPAYTGAYGDLSGRPTLGTAAAANTSDFDPAGTASSAITAHLGAASHHDPATLAASLQGILSLSGQELAATSPGAGLTRLLWWNPATSRLEFLIPGTNLSITSGQLNAAAGSPGGSDGQLQWNSGGAFAGLSTSAIDGSGNITWSGRIISSRNSAASAPAIQTTGTWFSGGTAITTQPHVLIQHSAATTNTAWATAGTGLAIYGSITNQRLIDAGANGASFFRLSGNTIEIGPTTFQAFWIDGLTLAMRFANSLGWSSGAATSASTLDTFWNRFSAGVIYQQGGTTAQSYWIANTITSSGTNFERMRMGWESNVFTLRTEAGGTGTARGIRIGSSSTQLLGFWGATPVTRPAAIPDATDLATAITAVNTLLAAARSTGLIAT